MKLIKIITVFILSLIHQQGRAEDLLSIFQQVLSHDPTLESARLKVERAEARYGQARGALFPQVNANVNLSLNKSASQQLGTDSYQGERYNVSLTQSVIDLPKYWSWEMHQELMEQSKKEYLFVKQNLIFDIVTRYFDVLESRDNLFLIQQEKNATVIQLRQIKRQYEKKLIKITDVYEIEAKLDVLKADEIDAEVKFLIAKQRLTELTGKDHQKLDSLKPHIEFTPLDDDILQLIERAKQKNPILHARKFSVNAAKDNLAQQRSKHFPVVDIQLNYYSTNTGFQNTATPSTETQVAAININVPLFSGGTTEKRAEEAASSLEISRQEYIAALRAVIKETKDAFLSTNANLRRIKASQIALKSSVKSREAMEKGFKYGVQTITDVLLSQSREYESRRDLLRAKYSYIRNRLRFERIIGEIDEEKLRIVNEWLVPTLALLDE